MKLKLTIVLLFVAFGLHAQKELQPYNFSLSDNGKTETIMIYASAEAVNSITFTLKNEKNETLKTKKDNSEETDITFKVFPFTENSFRSHLVDAINSIVEKDESKKEYDIFKTTLAPLKAIEEDNKEKDDDETKKKLATQLSKRKNAVQNVRNIFQFFDALAITAFQYDNEPVAGILKYEESVIVTKQTINGLDTDDYFHTQTAFIKKLILNSKGSKEEFIKFLSQKRRRQTELNGDDFILFLARKIVIKDEDDRIYRDSYESDLELEILCIKDNMSEDQCKLRSSLIIEKQARLNLSTLKRCKQKIPNSETDLLITRLEKKIFNYDSKLDDSNYETDTNAQKELIDIKVNLEKIQVLTLQDYQKYRLIQIEKRIKEIENQLSEVSVLKKRVDNIEEGSYLISLFDYYENIRKGNSKPEKLLELFIQKQLKEWYNSFELQKFTKGSFANNYFKEKYRKTLCEDIISEYSKLNDSAQKYIVDSENKIKESKNSIDSLKVLLNKNDTEIKDSYVNNNITARTSYFEPRQKALNKQIDDFDNAITLIKEEIAEKKKSKHSYKLFKKPFVDGAKKYQNKINFLIAKRKNQIVNIPWWRFQISNIEIDFNDGFIEHITVTGKTVIPEIDKVAILNSINKRHEEYYTDVNLENAFINFYQEAYVKDIFKDVMDKELKFDNEFPIGFSSKTDFADLRGYTLYAFEESEKAFSLSLGNVIRMYVQRHQNDRLDFSPKDQVLTLPLDDPDMDKQVELKKERSSKILNAKIFTDFNGLKESEPNGLVQIEVEKQIALWTKRKPLPRWLGRSANKGFFNYAVFNLTWAKLNEEDRELQVKKTESFVNNVSQTDNYLTYLDLIRFENISVGVDLNITTLDFPLVKTRLELNAGVHYGRVKVVDEITSTDDQGAESTVTIFEKDVNMIRMYPDVIVRIRPEERFGGYLRIRPFRTIVPDNEEFYSVYSADDFLENTNRSEALEDQGWLQRYELGASYTPSADSDNKFFFRYRYTNTFEWETNGYSEIQLGYQMYLKF